MLKVQRYVYGQVAWPTLLATLALGGVAVLDGKAPDYEY